jgi:hypothetical protein
LIAHFLVFGRVDHDPAETLLRACDPDSSWESGDSVALLSMPAAFAGSELVALIAAGIFAGWDWCPDSFREDARLLPVDPNETFVAPWVTRYNIESDGSVAVS